MRLLLDGCVWGPAAAELRGAGHDVAAVAEWPADPGDDAVLDAAMGEGRVLVTLDKDFGEIAILRGRAHSGIVRLVGFAARRQGGACRAVLDRYGAELEAGAIVVASPGRVRIRTGP